LRHKTTGVIVALDNTDEFIHELRKHYILVLSRGRLTVRKRKTFQSNIAFYIYTILSSVMIPLFTENKYFNITKAKADMFYVGSLCVLVSMFVCVLFQKSREKKAICQIEKISPILFSGCALISSVLSYSFERSFLGLDGWRVGLYVIVVLSVIFFYLSSRQLDSAFMTKVISVINIFIFGLVITDSMGMDIFGMHEMMLPNQYYDYVSTIGNVNQMAGYLSLIFLFLLVTVLTEKKSVWRNISQIALILGMFSIILCKSDGFYLGAGVCAFAMIPFLFKDKEMLTKTVTLGIAFCLTSLVIRFCGLFREKLKEIDGISQVVLNPEISVSLLIFLIIILFVLRRINLTDSMLRAIRITVTIGMIILVVWMGIINIKSASMDYYHWGSGRGAIWYESYRVYSEEYTLLQKLFGVGPDMLEQWYDNLSIGYGQKILVSHSEPIQVLMTLGAVGFAIYVAMVAFTIKKIINLKSDKHAARYCLPVLAYYGQSLVNSATITNLSLLVLFLTFVYNNFSDKT